MAELLAVMIAETLSLILVITSFAILTRLALRVRTLRSLQSQFFIFSLILTISEIPRILETLGLIDITPYQLLGLAVHTVSMIALGAFLVYRAYRFLR